MLRKKYMYQNPEFVEIGIEYYHKSVISCVRLGLLDFSLFHFIFFHSCYLQNKNVHFAYIFGNLINMCI